MARSALNQQHSRLTNRSLYFLLGLLSAGQRLEAQALRSSELESSSEAPAAVNQDYLYFWLGLLAFSRQLQTRLEAERDLVSRATSTAPDSSSDAFYGALY
ncbi:MAG TPA: hypothetical protein VKY59_00455 [Spirillospora sp.]|nr:hypothetical protein [Spirillospora sp.]